MMRALLCTGLVLLALALLALAGNAWANARVWTARYEIADEAIPRAFDGFTLCQVSDVHNEARGADNEALLTALREAQPDLICLTGDFFDSRRTDADFALDLAQDLLQIAPTAYVSGNHEARLSNREELEAALEALGVLILRDEWVPLERGGEEIALLGLCDVGVSAGEGWTLEKGLEQTQARLSTLLEQADGRFSVVLSHRPELLSAYAAAGADLALSGHAHGGQVRLPGIGGLYAPGQGVLPRLTSGVHESGRTRLVVSRGLGNSSFPLRVFNPPELVAVTLRAGTRTP